MNHEHDPHPAHQCAGKHGYDSRVLANEVAARSRRHRDAALQVYRCPCCAKWHIGGVNPVAKQARRDRRPHCGGGR